MALSNKETMGSKGKLKSKALCLRQIESNWRGSLIDLAIQQLRLLLLDCTLSQLYNSYKHCEKLPDSELIVSMGNSVLHGTCNGCSVLCSSSQDESSCGELLK